MTQKRSRTLAKWTSWIVLAGVVLFVVLAIAIVVGSR